MHELVRKAAPGFIRGYEGFTNYMYLDTKKLVTFGVGRMIDSSVGITDYGLALPWKDKVTKKYVLESRIKEEFKKVEKRTDLAPKGGYAFKDVSDIYVTDGVVNACLLDTIDDFWKIAKTYVPNLDELHPNAQLAIADMMYWMGPNFFKGFPNFTKSVKNADYKGMAANCGTRAKAPRDAKHKLLFSTAVKDKLTNVS